MSPLEEPSPPDVDEPWLPPIIEGILDWEAAVGCKTATVDEEMTETTGVEMSELPACSREVGSVLGGRVSKAAELAELAAEERVKSTGPVAVVATAAKEDGETEDG